MIGLIVDHSPVVQRQAIFGACEEYPLAFTLSAKTSLGRLDWNMMLITSRSGFFRNMDVLARWLALRPNTMCGHLAGDLPCLCFGLIRGYDGIMIQEQSLLGV